MGLASFLVPKLWTSSVVVLSRIVGSGSGSGGLGSSYCSDRTWDQRHEDVHFECWPWFHSPSAWRQTDTSSSWWWSFLGQFSHTQALSHWGESRIVTFFFLFPTLFKLLFLFSQGFRVTVVLLQQTWWKYLHNDLVYIHTFRSSPPLPPPPNIPLPVHHQMDLYIHLVRSAEEEGRSSSCCS